MDIDEHNEMDEIENDDDYEEDHVIPSSSSIKPEYPAISALSAAVRIYKSLFLTILI